MCEAGCAILQKQQLSARTLLLHSQFTTGETGFQFNYAAYLGHFLHQNSHRDVA